MIVLQTLTNILLFLI